MAYRDIYELWKNDMFFDEETRRELLLLDDEKEIEDRFYKELEFGTGGLRGIMGAGTNRMNRYTVMKATFGLGKYLLDTFGKELCRTHGVVIAYDTRINSKSFSRTTAEVLSGMGIKAYITSEPTPTPQLSFSVIYKKAVCGIVITASHNPKEYNGYKVYDEFGCQLVPDKAERVTSYIKDITELRDIIFDTDTNLIEEIDLTEEFVSAVVRQSRNKDEKSKNELSIVYTPLHGTGYIPVMKMFERTAFRTVNTVEKQVIPDGNFPTVTTPNPEDKNALELGIKLASQINADIVLGTDPDSDRVGVAVKKNNEFILLTGNQIGTLLVDYILNNTEFDNYKQYAVINTVVTSDLGKRIAEKHGIKTLSVLTGFKYIGDKITAFEQADKLDKNRNFKFLFGYEESYGYLAGTHARDKDAVSSVMLICEMAAELKKNNKTLLNKLEEIYAKYGYYYDKLESFTLKGKDGQNRIANMMSTLRNKKNIFGDMKNMIDFAEDVKQEYGFGLLPHSNVLKFIMNDDSWVAIRPSGTEPKIKLYYSIFGENKEIAIKKFKKIQKEIKSAIGLFK